MSVEGSGAGWTRREAIRRGATLGGVLIWAAPTVQIIHMSRAFAQTTSPTPGTTPTTQPTVTATTQPTQVLPTTVTTQPLGGGGPPAQVAAAGVTGGAGQPAGGGVQPQVGAEQLAVTGMELAPLAAIGGTLAAAGLATLKAARMAQTSGSGKHRADRPPESDAE